MTKSRGGFGISRYLGRIVGATEELVDDVLGRADDIERDVRRSVSKAVDYQDDRTDEAARGAGTRSGTGTGAVDPPREEIERLRAQLSALTQQIDRMSATR